MPGHIVETWRTDLRDRAEAELARRQAEQERMEAIDSQIQWLERAMEDRRRQKMVVAIERRMIERRRAP